MAPLKTHPYLTLFIKHILTSHQTHLPSEVPGAKLDGSQGAAERQVPDVDADSGERVSVPRHTHLVRVLTLGKVLRRTEQIVMTEI